MSLLGTTIGIAGNQTLKRIPIGSNIAYTHSATTHNLKVFNSIDKSVDSDTAQTTGNAGEWLAEKKRNDRVEFHVEAKVVAADIAGVLAIVADPPKRLDILTVTASEDTQFNQTGWYVNGKVDVRYSPDNDAIMSFDAILRLDDSGAPITIVALS